MIGALETILYEANPANDVSSFRRICAENGTPLFDATASKSGYLSAFALSAYYALAKPVIKGAVIGGATGAIIGGNAGIWALIGALVYSSIYYARISFDDREPNGIRHPIN